MNRFEVGLILFFGGHAVSGFIRGYRGSSRRKVIVPGPREQTVATRDGQWHEVAREPRSDDPSRLIIIERRTK